MCSGGLAGGKLLGSRLAGPVQVPQREALSGQIVASLLMCDALAGDLFIPTSYIWLDFHWTGVPLHCNLCGRLVICLSHLMGMLTIKSLHSPNGVGLLHRCVRWVSSPLLARTHIPWPI